MISLSGEHLGMFLVCQCPSDMQAMFDDVMELIDSTILSEGASSLNGEALARNNLLRQVYSAISSHITDMAGVHTVHSCSVTHNNYSSAALSPGPSSEWARRGDQN